jgi:PIN domain nuclease of toxin-antitoxin system
MSPAILLDTCALIFMVEGQLGAEAEDALGKAYADKRPTLVSPVSAWEIGVLVARGRLRVAADPLSWFRSAATQPGVALSSLPDDVLIGSSFLPGVPPRDPADRIILAAARKIGAAVMTRDRSILAYGREGHVATIAC